MRTMNYLILIAVMLFGTACTEPGQIEEELPVVKSQYASEEYDFLNGLDMYKRSVDVELYELERRIAELSEAMEAGEEGYEEELENTQRQQEVYVEYRELLDTFIRPIGGRGPGPRPPRGCYVANCKGGINIQGVQGVAIPSETRVEALVVKNSEGTIVGEGTELSENQFGDLMMGFETNEFEGVGTLQINTTIEGSGLGKVIINIPVTFE